MNSRFLIFFVSIILPILATATTDTPNHQCETKVFHLNGNSISFAGLEKGRELISEDDEFLNSMNELNIALRLQGPRKVSKSEFTDFLKNQVLCWNEHEIQKILTNVEAIFTKLSNLRIKKFHFPFTLIKTSGLEEANAPHTRRNFMIVPKGEISQQTIAHELFHIFSRANSELANELYEIVGFFIPDDGLQIPESLKSKVIVNPDAPKSSHAIFLKYDGNWVAVIPLITSKVSLSEIERSEIGFFRYIDFALYSLIDFSRIEVKDTNYFDLIGKNTSYIIHPEEILADNFKLLFAKENTDLPNPEILEQIVSLLVD